MRSKRNRILTEKIMNQYRMELIEEEKSKATIEKYLLNLKDFKKFADGNPVDKKLSIQYKEKLVRTYKARSVNARISALNGFFKRAEWYECILKHVKIQNESFRASNKVLSREEYDRLVMAAKSSGKEKLGLVIQTLCSMGLRVSELQFITVEATECGYAEATLKGKTRVVLMPDDLKILLENYISEQGIHSGCVFITRNGKPLDRANIWRGMKSLAEEAGIMKSKVFPHNLRHLFACVYYAEEKNANHLADIMGHSSLDTTRIYTQVSMEEELEALNKMKLVDSSY